MAEPTDRRALSTSGLGVRFASAVAVAVAGLAVLWVASAQSSQADDHIAARTELELISIRTDVARALRDDMTAQMAAPFGLVTSDAVAQAAEARVEAVARGWVELLALDVDPGIDAERHELLVDGFQTWIPTGPSAAPFDLYNGANQIEFEAVPPPSVPTTPVDAIQQLAWLDVGPQFVFQETLIAEFGHSETTPGPGLSEFFGLAAAFISGEPQVYGPDNTDPLTAGVYPTDQAQVHESATVDAVSNLLAETNIWEIDQRNAGFVPGTAMEGDVDLEALMDESASATNAVRGLVDQRLASRVDESLAAAEAATARASLAQYISTALFAVAAAGAVFIAVGQRRHSTELRRRVNIDPLTGVGNRNLLQSKTINLLADPELDHHTFVMIDMDRFKMVNDTYGHAAGDILLCEVARGLEVIADKMAAGRSTVVRLGGDEFTLTLHGASPIDRAALAEHLDALRGQTTSGIDGHPIPVAFSYGVAEATGSPALDDLLEAADLAAYDQKSVRHRPASIDLDKATTAE